VKFACFAGIRNQRRFLKTIPSFIYDAGLSIGGRVVIVDKKGVPTECNGFAVSDKPGFKDRFPLVWRRMMSSTSTKKCSQCTDAHGFGFDPKPMGLGWVLWVGFWVRPNPKTHGFCQDQGFPLNRGACQLFSTSCVPYLWGTPKRQIYSK